MEFLEQLLNQKSLFNYNHSLKARLTLSVATLYFTNTTYDNFQTWEYYEYILNFSNNYQAKNISCTATCNSFPKTISTLQLQPYIS